MGFECWQRLRPEFRPQICALNEALLERLTKVLRMARINYKNSIANIGKQQCSTIIGNVLGTRTGG